MSMTLERWHLFVRGVVQGVGFRPFVYALARRHGLVGHVGNTSAGVFIEVEGPRAALSTFEAALRAQPPTLAMIDAVDVTALAPRGDVAFVIVESEAQAAAGTPISPDICICDDCVRELFDPANRRYRYPFINCTNCGPRFTITKDVPYDRRLTTMAAFSLCADCAREYGDPGDRRFHAQPNACALCGPRVWFEAAPFVVDPPPREAGRLLESHSAALAAAQTLLRAGQILAVKGIGGFHLACDATNPDAVRLLRERKGRVDKPFALMVRDHDAARRIARIDAQESHLLISRERPIVLVRSQESNLAAAVAPGNRYVGLMLPYTPLHYLLLDGLDTPLVMTSGNRSDEPICTANDDARRTLAVLCDGFLMHDRDIHVWCDDSVVRVFRDHELPVRRSRGYAPFPIKLAGAHPPVLAVGGELKATFCLTRDGYAFMSQHIGDMETLETQHAFERAVEHFVGLFHATPALIACDAHPGYLSSQWAARYARQRGVPLVKVQHHHAHIVACLAEHGRPAGENVIGISFDGTGYGADGAIWGGEVMLANCAGFERVAHLAYVPLPGGDAAVKRPYRAALAHLRAAGIAWSDDLPCVRDCPPAERRVLAQQLARNINCVPTSSMGRLFDAVAALIGVRQTVTYEAQAAIEMESLCDAAADGAYAFAVSGADIDPAPMLRAIVADLARETPVATIATRAHRAVAAMIAQVCERERARTAVNTVALSGGVFQNVTLLALAVERLEAARFEVLWHAKVPPNDGGLALGQAVIARAEPLRFT